MKAMKIPALLLAAILAASALASCGGSGEPSSEISEESSVSSGLTEESSAESSEESSEESSAEAEESSEESSQSESAEPSEDSAPAESSQTAPESSASSKPASKPAGGSASSSKPASQPSGGSSSSQPPAEESSTQAPPPAQSVNTDDTTPDGAEASLETLIDQLYEGIAEENMPMVMNITLSAENSEYYVGVPFSSYTEGLASDSAIGSIAHSVCLLRASDADAAASLAKEVEANANPAKWICVTAEKMIVKQKGDLVLLIMASSDNADIISANFDALDI